MKLFCKCGHCLTNDLKKVHHSEATEISGTKTYIGIESVTHEYQVKDGVYFKWKRKWASFGDKSAIKGVYCVSVADSQVGAEIINGTRGCCKFDSFDLICGKCYTIVGEGGNDCWQLAKSMFHARKVHVKP